MSTLASKPVRYWTIYFAIREAADDPREAPWYGPWNIVLQDLFHGFCVAPFITVTYPQYPVVKNIDSVDPRDDDDDDDSDNEKHNDKARLFVL
jgi:hypothetical protein